MTTTATTAALSSLSSTQSPWLYFLAGTIVPTIAWLFLSPAKTTPANASSGGTNDDDDDDHGDDYDDSSDDDTGAIPTTDDLSRKPQDWGVQDAPYKMILVVNMELKGMGNGKKMAQCCHAAVGCYKHAMKVCPSAVKWWDRTGCAKIAVKCPTEDEMIEIWQKARSIGMPCYLVEDAGRTQIAAGSRTVLGLGPAPAYVYDGLTSHLKLV
jgi:peptidyl-tRNA hydrolase, PTH2 family